MSKCDCRIKKKSIYMLIKKDRGMKIYEKANFEFKFGNFEKKM